MGGGANWEYKTIIFWDQRSSTKDNCRYTVMKMKVLTFTEIYCWRVWVIKSLTEGWSIEFTRKQRSNCLSISSAFASEKNTFCEVSITHIPPLQNFHKIQKIRQTRHCWQLGHKMPNWVGPQTYLQPKFQISSLKNNQDIDCFLDTLKYKKFSQN